MELVIGCRKYNQIIVYQFLIRPVEGYDQNMTQTNVHTRLNGPGSGKIEAHLGALVTKALKCGCLEELQFL